MKIYNRKEEFTITFDNKDFFIPKGFSECNIDIFKHIQTKSIEWWLDVVDASSWVLEQKEEATLSEEVVVPTDEEVAAEIEELKSELDKNEEVSIVKPKGKSWRPKSK